MERFYDARSLLDTRGRGTLLPRLAVPGLLSKVSGLGVYVLGNNCGSFLASRGADSIPKSCRDLRSDPMQNGWPGIGLLDRIVVSSARGRAEIVRGGAGGAPGDGPPLGQFDVLQTRLVAVWRISPNGGLYGYGILLRVLSCDGSVG